MANENSEPEELDSEGAPFEVDRRDHRRVPLDADVTVRSSTDGSGFSDQPTGLSEEAEFSVQGRGGDISVGGMYIIARDRLPAGSTVEVEFELDDLDEEFDLIAQVRWTRRMPRPDGTTWWAVGLEFEEIEPPSKDVLDEFVLRELSE